MKRGELGLLALGVALVFLPLFGGCLQQPGLSTEAATVTKPAGGELAYSVVPGPSADAADIEETPDPQDVSSAPVTPVNTNKPLPDNIKPTESLAQLIRLAQAGLEQSVLEAFVTNSTGTFSLGPEEIIYLNDIGIPAQVLSTMLQHDHLLITAAANPPAPPPAEPLPEITSAEPVEAPMTPEQGFSGDYQPAPEAGPPPEPDFYDALSPYGTWVDVGGYGRCWQPSVVVINHDWRPYCDRGHWAYTDCGWYWQSDYSWGWAPFHYGRWFCHQSLGWCWQPDLVWGPSWVCWRSTDQFCGWAPLPPSACFRPGFGFTYLGAPIGVGCSFGLSANCFTFVAARNFCDFRISHFALDRHQVNSVFKSTTTSTTIVTEHNLVVNSGIPAARIAAATHGQIRPVPVRQLVSTDAPALVAQQFQAGGRGLAVARSGHNTVLRTPQTFTEREAAAARGATGSAALSNPGQSAAPASNPNVTIAGKTAERMSRADLTAGAATSANGSTRTYRRWSGRPTETSPALPNARGDISANSSPGPSQGFANRGAATAGRTAVGEPLIIRGAGRTGEIQSRQNQFSRQNTPSFNTGGPMAYREPAQRSSGGWGTPQAPARLDPSEASFRQRLENRAAATQSMPARDYNSRSYAAPAYQAPAVESHHYSAPAYSPPPSYSRNEPAPAPAPAHVSESHSAPAPAPSSDHSSSGRGR